MYRHNGGLKGKKRGDASQSGMWTAAKGVIRGRSNGGFMGVEMRSADLQDNINKLSGMHFSTFSSFTEYPICSG